jgi:hypothetical protein
MLVAFRLDQHIEDLALGVDGAPQVDHAAIDLEIDLIQMPVDTEHSIRGGMRDKIR